MKPASGARAFLVACLALVAAASSLAALGLSMHFALAKSLPVDQSTVAEVSEVRLWFTEAPEDGTVAIRVLDASGQPALADDVAQDANDAKVFSVALPHGLDAGRYSVQWRGMSDDGHVTRGDLTFTVAAH